MSEMASSLKDNLVPMTPAQRLRVGMEPSRRLRELAPMADLGCMPQLRNDKCPLNVTVFWSFGFWQVPIAIHGGSGYIRVGPLRSGVALQAVQRAVYPQRVGCVAAHRPGSPTIGVTVRVRVRVRVSVRLRIRIRIRVRVRVRVRIRIRVRSAECALFVSYVLISRGKRPFAQMACL